MNPYEVLGLDPSASQEDIKAAYRKLIKEHHPDRGGDADKSKEINQAYDLIKDEESRQRYDQGNNDQSIAEEWFRNRSERFFNPFANQRRERPNPQSDEDLRFRYGFKLSDLKQGIQDTIVFKRRIECPSCNGTGGSGKNICNTCKGSGNQIYQQRNGNQMFIQQSVCNDCNGLGYTFEKPCEDCNAIGIVMKEEEVTFEIKEVK